MSRLIAILIRHGDYHQLSNTPSALQPFGLNGNGRSQSAKAIELLKQMQASSNAIFHPVIDSSTLLRSWQTADIIVHGLNAIDNIEVFDALTERGLGSVANLTIEQIENAIEQDPRFDSPPKDWKSNSYYCLPYQGAESLIDAGKRVADHLLKRMSAIDARILTSSEQDTFKIFVGHGAAFRHAAYHLGVMKFEEIAKLSMYYAQPLALEMHKDGSFSHAAGEWKIRPDVDSQLD